ncbi:NfeD family protein [Diaphorobacter ruginosibacter]|uniref:NfeD family protein n=1 Tax=Diaphorobacter ruginosibacter TaxID=1715720 RepID=A0A7G9RU61_9BURK|nr:NfeD family protein [Diaphorobacter ruginosibacter]QNN59136.1 NfeD family protein [Diaphorobacter ruginosibacter]
MHWDHATLWWIMAGITVAAELLIGSFYLLMIALGLAAGGLAAFAGLGDTAQVLIAALVGAMSVLCCYFMRRTRPGDPSPRSDRSVNLDIGETVYIDAWQSDGTAQVKYRGATWTAIHRPGITPATGNHRVSELVGNRLLVDPV